LDNYSVSDVLLDREGGTWFTTLENGIYYSTPARFLSYQHQSEQALYSSYGVSKLDSNHLLFSNKLNLVDIISDTAIKRNVDVRSPEFLHFLDALNIPLLRINTGNTSKADSFKSYMWLREEHRLEPIIYRENKLVAELFFLKESTHQIYLFDRYWVRVFDPSKKIFKNSFLLPSRTFSFYKDKKGVIWLGCLNGLWSFENETFIYHGNENDLLKSAIEDIKEDVNGTRYYATRGNGVLVYRDGNYTKITTANGLTSNNCKCLCVEQNNTVWVGSKNGICKLKYINGTWQVLKFNLNNTFDYEIFGIEKIKKTLWLFTNRGLLSYELGTNEAEFLPQIYINQFLVNETTHLKDSIRDFRYDENFIKLSFIGLSFQSLGKLYYTYKLDGLDTNWHTTLSTSLQYPFLPPGDYTFLIKAVSFSGAESRYTASVHFTIRKPFWKTTWFLISVFLALAGGTYLVFYYRLQTVKKKEEQKTLFNKQMAELEMKALRSQMNPHFIFNAINSIQNYIVKNDSRTAQDYLAKFARLIRNVLENSRHEQIALRNELDTLKLYIELEQLRSPGKFIFKFTAGSEVNLDTTLIPPLILQPFVENAILHGLIPLTDRQGELTISLEKTNNKLLCIIEDNGIGRKRARESRQKKQLAHQSMGLAVTESRIKAISGLQKEASGITIEDKTDPAGEGTGTRVIIAINLDK
jgi:two-component sensor histidine kinase